MPTAISSHLIAGRCRCRCVGHVLDTRGQIAAHRTRTGAGAGAGSGSAAPLPHAGTRPLFLSTQLCLPDTRLHTHTHTSPLPAAAAAAAQQPCTRARFSAACLAEYSTCTRIHLAGGKGSQPLTRLEDPPPPRKISDLFICSVHNHPVCPKQLSQLTTKKITCCTARSWRHAWFVLAHPQAYRCSTTAARPMTPAPAPRPPQVTCRLNYRKCKCPALPCPAPSALCHPRPPNF